MADTPETRGMTHSQTAHLREVDELFVNSSKPVKIFWARAVLDYLAYEGQSEHLLEDKMGSVRAHESVNRYDEPAFGFARHASEHKADWLQAQMFERVTTCGADSTFWVWNEKNASWVQFHKMERQVTRGKNPAELIAQRYRAHRDLAVFNPSGRVKAAWELSTTYKNGGTDTFGQFLLVDFKSFDRELLWEEVGKAVRDGNIFSTAPGMAYMEAIVRSDPMAKMGFISFDEAKRKGSKAWLDLRPADEVMIKLAMTAVLTTMPVGLFESDDGIRVFEKAYELASKVGEI